MSFMIQFNHLIENWNPDIKVIPNESNFCNMSNIRDSLETCLTSNLTTKRLTNIEIALELYQHGLVKDTYVKNLILT